MFDKSSPYPHASWGRNTGKSFLPLAAALGHLCFSVIKLIQIIADFWYLYRLGCFNFLGDT